MNYLIIYDKNERGFGGMGLSVLEQAYNVKIRKVINGEYLLSFNFPRNDEKWQYIKPENLVKCEGQIFRIRRINDGRDGSGKLTGEVNCEHITYDLNNAAFIPYFEWIGSTPTQILTAALDGTGFTIGTIDADLPATDIELSKTNPMKVINKLVENVGGELVRDNFTVSLVKRIGSDKGIQFRVNKGNLPEIKREVDDTSVITELWPLGKDGMQIDSVNGVPYLRSPLYNAQNPRRNFMDFPDIEDAAELMAKGLEQFSTDLKDGIDKPKVSYSGSINELKKLKEYGDFEAFGLGDMVGIFDTNLGISTKQRILEYEYYPYEAQKSTVGMANYEPKLYRENNIGNILGSLILNKRTVQQVMTPSGGINAQYLDNIRERLQTEINGFIQKALLHQQADLYVDDIHNPQKAILIGNGIIAISNQKDSSGKWVFRTIATGDKVIADEVSANFVYAGKVKCDQLESGGTISGVRIEGTTFYGGTMEGTIIIGGRFCNESGTGWMTINQESGNIADFNFWTATSPGTPLFTLYDSIGGVVLMCMGMGFLAASGSGASPLGSWDCSSAIFSGLRNANGSWYATQEWVTANFVHK